MPSAALGITGQREFCEPASALDGLPGWRPRVCAGQGHAAHRCFTRGAAQGVQISTEGFLKKDLRWTSKDSGNRSTLRAGRTIKGLCQKCSEGELDGEPAPGSLLRVPPSSEHECGLLEPSTHHGLCSAPGLTVAAPSRTQSGHHTWTRRSSY